MSKKMKFIAVLGVSLSLISGVVGNSNVKANFDDYESEEVSTYGVSNMRSEASSGGGVNPWEHMFIAQPYDFYRNSVTNEWEMKRLRGTVDHVFKIVSDGWGSAGAGYPARYTVRR